MILQCALLFIFLAAGELIVELTGVPVPSSIIGMLLLTISLKAKIVRLMWIEQVADFLVKNLGFFFVPAGVGIMGRLELISREWIPIVGATIISTIVIIAVTGRVHQVVRHLTGSTHHSTSNGYGHSDK